MEASSTLEDIRPPVVSRWSQKLKKKLLFEVTMSEYTVIFIMEVSVDNLEYS